MARTVGKIGYGTTLAYAAAGATPTWTTIAEVDDIKMPKHVHTPVEVDRYDSDAAVSELIPGWGKAGELEMTLTYNAAQAAALFALWGQPCQFRVVKPDTKGWVYQGILTEFGDVVPLKAKMQVDAKFSISGMPVADASSA